MVNILINGTAVEADNHPELARNMLEQDDFGNIEILNTRAEKYAEFSTVDITTNGVVEQFVVAADRVEQKNETQHHHIVRLGENKHYFKHIFPENRPFTRGYTINSVLDIYKETLEFYKNIKIDFDSTDSNYNKILNDKEFIDRSFYDIITELFREFDAIPLFTRNGDVWNIDYMKYTMRNNPTDIIERTNRYQTENDPVNSATSVISHAQNASYEENPIWFPNKDFGVRCRFNSRITVDSSAEFQLDSEIRRIVKVVAKDVEVHDVNSDGVVTIDVDITQNVLTGTAQDALREVNPFNVYDDINLRNTIRYDIGDNRVYQLFTSDNKMISFLTTNVDHLQNAVYYNVQEQNLSPYEAFEIITEYDDFKLQFQYIPRREIGFEVEKQDVRNKVYSEMINAQNDSNIELSRYEQNLFGLAQRIGNDTRTYGGIYGYNETLPKRGDYSGDWKVVFVKYVYYPNHIAVIVEMAKHFNNIRSEYAASREIDQRPITGRTAFTNVMSKTYVELSTTVRTDTDLFMTTAGRNFLLNDLDFESQYSGQITEGLFTPKGFVLPQPPGGYDLADPIHLQAIVSGNSGGLKMHTQFRDPKIAGRQVEDNYSVPVPYTDWVGELPQFDLKIGRGVFLDDSDRSYPVVPDTMSDLLFHFEDMPLHLDADGAYAHTHHVMFITDEPSKIIINKNFARLNQLATDTPLSLQFYKRNRPFNVLDYDITTETPFSDSFNLDRLNWTLTLATGTEVADYWCVADTNGNILLAFNNIAPSQFQLRINFLRRRNYG